MNTAITDIKQIDEELGSLLEKRKEISERIAQLNILRKEHNSKKWIADNKITRKDVLLKEERPLTTSKCEFFKQLERYSTNKKFVEWLGNILEIRRSPENMYDFRLAYTPGLVKDLPE